MIKFREFRIKRGFNSRQMAAVIGCTHTDVTKMELRSSNNSASVAVCHLLMADFERNARSLLYVWADLEKPVCGKKKVIDMKQAARKVMVPAEYLKWEVLFDRRCDTFGVIARAD